MIVKLAEHEVADPGGLRNLAAGLDVGVQVPLTYYREGKSHTVKVTIDELPPAPEVLTSLGFRVRSRSTDDGGGPLSKLTR